MRSHVYKTGKAIVCCQLKHIQNLFSSPGRDICNAQTYSEGTFVNVSLEDCQESFGLIRRKLPVDGFVPGKEGSRITRDLNSCRNMTGGNTEVNSRLAL